MNDITTYQNNTPAQGFGQPQAAGVALQTVTTQATQNTVDLVAWANELGAAHQIAQAICSTEFVPKEFRGNPDKTATAILYGKSIGLDPLAALANVFVVHGRPAMYSRTMVALAQRAGVEFQRTEATEQQVTVHARRKGSQTWQTFTWSVARATKAGYTTNAKYKTDPIGMLTAKAYAEAVRVIAPDVLMGIAVSEEAELGDYDTPASTPAIEEDGEAPKKRVQRKPRAKKDPEPVHVAEAPEEPAQDTGEAMSKEQADAVYALGQGWGVSSAEEMNTRLSETLGEPVTFDTLTASQADRVLTNQ